MTVVFSTSSPLASVALLDGGKLVAEGAQDANQRASGVCLFLLEQMMRQRGISLRDVRMFVADLGPGSFTGVKVGVTIAKTMAFAMRAQAAGVSSFDLIDPTSTVVVPSRKGEFYVRTPGKEPAVVDSVPSGATGYGSAMADQRLPLASRAAALFPFAAVAPEQLLPLYVSEPSISRAKDPRVTGGNRA